MLKKSRALCLIEILVYIASFATLTLLIFGYFSKTQNRLLLESVAQDNIIKKNIIQDLINRDLYSASKDPMDWDRGNFVFKKNMLNNEGVSYPVCVGYTFCKDGVRRLEGDYNFVIHKWTKKITSVVSNSYFARQDFYEK